MQIKVQTFHHIQKNIHPIFDDFETMYAATSLKEGIKGFTQPVLDSAFEPLYGLFSENGYNGTLLFKDKGFDALKNVPDSPKTIIVCVSGGKDSLATLLHYKKAKYKIIAYHLKGINFMFKDEYVHVQSLCDKLGIPLVLEEALLRGNRDWYEHPMKNMLIANMAIQWGIRNGITTNIAFGNFSTSTLNSDRFDICGGDCRELWQAYEDIMHNILPNLTINTPLTNFADTVDAMIKRPDLIDDICSCIGSFRYREYLREKNEAKYKVKILPHRCGSCWKCCLEYCVLVNEGILQKNEAFYGHCLKVLQNTLNEEEQCKHTIEETKAHYFFYKEN